MEIAESLQDYLYLHTFDLSQNKIEGLAGGRAVAKLITRSPEKNGGIALTKLDLSHNKLGNHGFSLILEPLTEQHKRLEFLNLRYNDIKLFVGPMFEKSHFPLTIGVENLVMDGN